MVPISRWRGKGAEREKGLLAAHFGCTDWRRLRDSARLFRLPSAEHAGGRCSWLISFSFLDVLRSMLLLGLVHIDPQIKCAWMDNLVLRLDLEHRAPVLIFKR